MQFASRIACDIATHVGKVEFHATKIKRRDSVERIRCVAEHPVEFQRYDGISPLGRFEHLCALRTASERPRARDAFLGENPPEL